MKTSKELLSSLLKTTQMGQVGIRSVLDTTMQPGLRRALMDQLTEYDSIETEAHSIAAQRGWELEELDPALRLMSDMATRMKLRGKNTDSKIAGMMIQGSTRGIIKGLKNAHQHIHQDERVSALNQRLMDFEESSILRMKPYL